jgi:hypothetical protein
VVAGVDAAAVGAVVGVAAGAEPRMTGTWWRGRVPVVVTRGVAGSGSVVEGYRRSTSAAWTAWPATGSPTVMRALPSG